MKRIRKINSNENKNTMSHQLGISLIVLVITIIVIIILAAAVILTINNNNPMSNANKARYLSDRANIQDALSSAIGNISASQLAPVKIPFQGDITDGIEYTMEGAADGRAGGKIGWDTVATNVPTGYDTSVILGVKKPVYQADTIWGIDQGNIVLTVGNIRYEGTAQKEIKLLILQNNEVQNGGPIAKEPPNMKEIETIFGSVTYRPDLTYDQIIEQGFTHVMANARYWGMSKPELLNQLYQAGLHIYSMGNDTYADIDIIDYTLKKDRLEEESESLQMVTKNWLTNRFPTGLKQEMDSTWMIKENSKAQILYDFAYEGVRYPGVIYMENEKHARWIHFQAFVMNDALTKSVLQCFKAF